MSHPVATERYVDRGELLELLQERTHAILVTTRRDGRPQLSPVLAAVDGDGHLVVATYPDRAKARNARRDPQVAVCVLSDDFDGAWVQVDGTAEVVDAADGTCLIRVHIDRWGPVSQGALAAPRSDPR